MEVIMKVKDYHTASQLQKFYISEKNPKLAHRIQGVYLASKGLTCLEIVNVTGFSRRAIQQWIAKYNKGNINALKDSPRSGQPSKLSKQQEKALCKRIEAGPAKADGIASLNGPVIRQILELEFGVVYSLWGIYHLLHRLGYSCLCPRPQHENSNPQLQAEFKKTSQRCWMQSNQSIQAKK